MRRTVGIGALAFGVFLSGCQKPYFITELDYKHYNDVAGDVRRAEYETQNPVPVSEPRTVRLPEGNVQWELSLEETKRIAITNNKQIAFLGYQPAEAGTVIDLELSAFDAKVGIGGGWTYQDQPLRNNLQVFGTNANAVQNDFFGSQSAAGFGPDGTIRNSPEIFGLSGLSSDLFSVIKRNATGGESLIGYRLDYSRQQPISEFTTINPAWQSEVRARIVQPLLRGAGVEFNRAPMLIARANYEQSIKTFEANVQTLLRDVETAYWQLYFTYSDLKSRETGMTQALATWQQERHKESVGTSATPQVAQAREQFEFFRASRVQALGRVITAEQKLRQLMGLPPDDGRQIVPQDPSIAAFAPNWQAGVAEAMTTRPEIVAQRFRIRAAELEVFRQRNFLLPELNFSAEYHVVGLDNQFDQSIDRLTDNVFTQWDLGVRYQAPVGFRAAHATVRAANLALGRERKTLENIEHNVLHELHDAFQNIVTQYYLIGVQKDRREAAVAFLRAQDQFYRQGARGYTLDVLLQAQSAVADALRDESLAITLYNQAIAQWEFSKGTILANDNVVLAEDQISRMPDKVLQRRERWWRTGLPLPIHEGTHIHGDDLPTSVEPPLYAPELFETPVQGDKKPVNEKPVEAAAAKTTKTETKIPRIAPSLLPRPTTTGAKPATTAAPVATTPAAANYPSISSRRSELLPPPPAVAPTSLPNKRAPAPIVR